MGNEEQQTEKYLESFNSEIASLAQQLRDFLKKVTKPTTELVGDSTISLNIGYGFTEKAWDCFCAIIVYSKHINISFPSGASLSDPKKLLQGTGKQIRHIKIKKFDDIKSPEVLGLLLEAKNNAREILEIKADIKLGVKIIIKPIAGIKKNPSNVLKT